MAVPIAASSHGFGARTGKRQDGVQNATAKSENEHARTSTGESGSAERMNAVFDPKPGAIVIYALGAEARRRSSRDIRVAKLDACNRVLSDARSRHRVNNKPNPGNSAPQ